MEASDIYKCIADPQRLRILNLLDAGPLCVCHLQEILEVSQVKMSKQLAIMKQLGLLEAHREGTWMVYHLAQPVPGLIQTNLDYLLGGKCAECNQLQQDHIARGKLIQVIAQDSPDCPQSVCGQEQCC
ncbi:MAG: metalloregulator ArsR/SmtB family transcription factor [Opitutae bacterium]|jgi:ArsR family transcriptional regulator|nr:metalloregulator ArsR/SmtB family transcription factor [Opitutae bacterium]MDG1301873.1 metalloregulator ArsR/SmtB family transcription factor [Opitutae bacterium]